MSSLDGRRKLFFIFICINIIVTLHLISNQENKTEQIKRWVLTRSDILKGKNVSADDVLLKKKGEQLVHHEHSTQREKRDTFNVVTNVQKNENLQKIEPAKILVKPDITTTNLPTTKPVVKVTTTTKPTAPPTKKVTTTTNKKVVNVVKEPTTTTKNAISDPYDFLKNNPKLHHWDPTAANKTKEKYTIPKLDASIPWVFAITPTYYRYTQKADLTRLSQTLHHVTNFHWLIIEDSANKSDLVTRFLRESKLIFTHLLAVTDNANKKNPKSKYIVRHRGVDQRNTGLNWLEKNIDTEKTKGVVYFMDDDNTYNVKIFDQMRYTKRVSVWPVGISGGGMWEGPIIINGTVAGFHSNWRPDRPFPMDMAGFAVSIKVALKRVPPILFNKRAMNGYLETLFLQSVTSVKRLEPLANNCTEVLVWHTQTKVPPMKFIKGLSDPNLPFPDIEA